MNIDRLLEALSVVLSDRYGVQIIVRDKGESDERRIS